MSVESSHPLYPDTSEPCPIAARDGTRLAAWRWAPEGSCRGCVVIVHGFSEHGRRYEHVARALTRDGWAVLALDQRGHGRSPGARGVLRAFPTLVADVGSAVEVARDELAGGGPVVLLAHSLGGLVGLRAVQSGEASVDALILSAPWLGAVKGVSRFERQAIAWLARLAPTLSIPRPMSTDALVADAEMAADRRSDPLVYSRISAGLIVEVERAQARARAASVPPDLSVLVIIPGDDRLLDHHELREWIARQTDARIEVQEWAGRRHEPLNDLGREELIEHLVEWLDRHAPVGNTALEPGEIKRVSP